MFYVRGSFGPDTHLWTSGRTPSTPLDPPHDPGCTVQHPTKDPRGRNGRRVAVETVIGVPRRVHTLYRPRSLGRGPGRHWIKLGGRYVGGTLCQGYTNEDEPLRTPRGNVRVGGWRQVTKTSTKGAGRGRPPRRNCKYAQTVHGPRYPSLNTNN